MQWFKLLLKMELAVIFETVTRIQPYILRQKVVMVKTYFEKKNENRIWCGWVTFLVTEWVSLNEMRLFCISHFSWCRKCENCPNIGQQRSWCQSQGCFWLDSITFSSISRLTIFISCYWNSLWCHDVFMRKLKKFRTQIVNTSYRFRSLFAHIRPSINCKIPSWEWGWCWSKKRISINAIRLECRQW